MALQVLPYFLIRMFLYVTKVQLLTSVNLHVFFIYSTISIPILSTDPIMSFIISFFLQIKIQSGFHIKFSCHVFLGSFGLEHSHSFCLL